MLEDSGRDARADVLCGEGGVVHEENVNIGDCNALATSCCES
jgi:hypothetical protein